jgi:murein L,D-transpeptidase YcbB/YkuD
MWQTWHTSPPWWAHSLRVLLASGIVCLSACTATDCPLSTPSALFQAGSHGRAARPALDRLLTAGDIQVAETHLRDFGFDPGPVDGLFTAQTQVAIRAFQARYGLMDSGLLDHETRRELLPGFDQQEFDP